MIARLAAARRELTGLTLTGAAPRTAVVLLGVAGIALANPGPVLTVLTALALLVSVLAPERVGAGAPAVVLVGGWIIAHGVHDAPLVRTVLFALVVYLVTSAGALAAAVPHTAQVRAAVFAGWGRRLLLPSAATIVVGAVLTVPGRLPGSALLDVLGLIGAVGVIAVVARALGRR